MVTRTVDFIRGWCAGVAPPGWRRRGGRPGRGRRRGVGRWSALPRVPHLPVDDGSVWRAGRFDGGFDDGAGFGVEPEPVLGDPAADVVPAGQDGQPAVPVLDLLQQQTQAVPGQQRRPDPADSGRAVDLHPWPPARRRPRRPRPARAAGSAAASSEATTQPADTDSRPSSPPPAPPPDDAPAAPHGAGQLADRLGDQPGLAGVQRRAPVGHPLGTDPACDPATSPRATASAVTVNRPAAATAASASTTGKHRVQVRTGEPVHPRGQVGQHGGRSGQHGDQLVAVGPHPGVHVHTLEPHHRQPHDHPIPFIHNRIRADLSTWSVHFVPPAPPGSRPDLGRRNASSSNSRAASCAAASRPAPR